MEGFIFVVKLSPMGRTVWIIFPIPPSIGAQVTDHILSQLPHRAYMRQRIGSAWVQIISTNAWLLSIGVLILDPAWSLFREFHFGVMLCYILTIHELILSLINPWSRIQHDPIRTWIGLWLVQKMVCRMFDAKPLPEPMVIYCQLDP